jgi:spermidine dehydrogenase
VDSTINANDKRLGMDRRITRRDLLNGASVAIGTSLAGRAAADQPDGHVGSALQRPEDYYPPKLTGMRGSHEGSFEVAHEMRYGKAWDNAEESGERYDLVVVGAGLSGLAAAYYFRKALPEAKVLILDNHDDFGGHAKRVEFTVGDRQLIGYGGTQFITGYYPNAGKQLLGDIGVSAERFPAGSANDLYRELGLRSGVFFDRETFGVDRLVVGEPRRSRGPQARRRWTQFLGETPLSEAAKAGILKLYTEEHDYLAGLTDDEKIARLRRMSYQSYILDVVGVHQDVVPYLLRRGDPNGAAGIDSYSAWGALRSGSFPGFGGLGLERPARNAAPGDNPFQGIHFPDGNAGIARLIVRWLIPAALPGGTMEDSVTTPIRYSELDKAGNPVRIRLSSTVVRARHAGDRRTASEVSVTYVQNGRALRVSAGSCVMACYNAMIPYLCPEIPADQQAALKMAVRKPYVYTQVAINNWTSFANLGVGAIHSPGAFHKTIGLDWGVNVGDYRHSASPDEPILLWLERIPIRPGLSARDQFRAGREELLATSFETFERNIRDQLGRALGEGSFDPARDIAAITVNRWPHGYAGAGNDLYDPDWSYDEAPWVVGRQRFGRITVANSDAAAISLTQAAFDQAYRAVQELLTDVIRPEFQYPWAERT